jgi:hypothetical protein
MTWHLKYLEILLRLINTGEFLSGENEIVPSQFSHQQAVYWVVRAGNRSEFWEYEGGTNL